MQTTALMLVSQDLVLCGGPPRLGEDDGLGGGVAREHAAELLAQRLDLGAALEVGQLHAVQDAALARARHPRLRLRHTAFRRHHPAAHTLSHAAYDTQN